MPFSRARSATLTLLFGALVTLGTSCPRPPAAVPAVPATPPRDEVVPPPIERPIPPGKQGDVPEVPPPVKP